MDRYSRQIALKDFGPKNQEKLKASKVLLVGLGGLGVPVAQYLCGMGIGTLGLVENDTIALHNLQRQVLYPETSVGQSKLKVAQQELQKRNNEVEFQGFETFLDVANALDIIKDFDVVVDATDNFASRYLINDACVILRKPLVYGALHAFEGQVSVFNYRGGPTYRCLFPEMPKAHEIPNCDENGILGVLPGIIGSLQALEVIKVITGVGDVLSGKLMLYDGLTQSVQKIGFKQNSENIKLKALQNDYGFTGCEPLKAIEWEALEQKQDLKQLIDVRTIQEYSESHLESAIHIPLDTLEQEQHKIDFSQTVYLICQSGKRSAIAATLLGKQHPKAEIVQIAGGMNAIQTSCL